MIEPDYKALFESEQKQRLEAVEFARFYNAVEAKFEIERLTAINAELLAACEAAEKYINDAEYESNSSSTLEQIEAAIANAQPKGDLTND